MAARPGPGRADPSCVVAALASTPRVERAIILDCGFTDDMARKIARALARCCRPMSALILPQSRITSVGTRHLSAGLLIHAGLHTLDLSGNACGDHGSESLAVLVCSSPALRAQPERQQHRPRRRGRARGRPCPLR